MQELAPRKRAIVTGASAGVGRAVAQRLAEVGFDVALIARNEAGLEEVAGLVEARGGRALVLPCDVADAAALDAAADRVAAEWGGIDVWINNAMATVFSRVEDVTPDELRRVTDVTYHGTVFGTQAALRHMRPRDSGTIVQIGSALAYRAIPLQSAYCAAKHAVVGFTESVISELIHTKSRIEVSMVHLPAVNTPQFAWSRTHIGATPRPAGTPIRPEVAADAIVEAALNPQREVYVGWPTVKAIFGTMALPAYADIEAAKSWEGQIEDPNGTERPGNLFEPVTTVPRDRGPFRDETSTRAITLSGLGARATLAAACATGLALVGWLTYSAGRRAPRP